MPKRLLGFALAFCFAFSAAAPAYAHSGATQQFYTYNYDFWGEARESPDPYAADRVLMGVDLGLNNFRNPQGLFVQGDRIFVVDSGNNRIVELNGRYELVGIIDSFDLNGFPGPDTFNMPHDIFVTPRGHYYVADTDNNRVVHLDENLRALNMIFKPQDALMDEIAEFLPTKLVVDDADRLYLLARNMTRGIMEFDAAGDFSGYIGANRVNFSLVDMVWRTLSTRAQRERMALFIPTEYNNMTLDRKGFIYTTTSTFSESDLLALVNAEDDDFLANLFGIGDSSNVQPIRRLNAMGADILIRNGWVPPIGDWSWTTDNSVRSGPSRFVDIAVNQQDTYFALDRNRGRIFGYDFQGNLLFVFGGLGSRAGYFVFPSAIAYHNGALLVLDAQTGGLTIFNPTEYGQLIHDALREYVLGNYDVSADLWSQVLMFNANYDLAYIGLGRALLRQGRFYEAMGYFQLKHDRQNFSKAFQQYRKELVERNIGFIVGGIIFLIVLNVGWKQLRRVLANRARKGAGHGNNKGLEGV